MNKKISRWKTLSSKVVYEHKNLVLHEDTVGLPNGKITTYLRRSAAITHSVIIIAINSKEEILVQREYSYPPNIIMWQLPGGSMKSKEKILDAAMRELAEESGIGANQARKIGYFYTQNRFSNQKQYVIECRDLYAHKLKEDDDEFIESLWLTRDSIGELIRKGRINNINLLAALNLLYNNI